ncbi:MAG: hypothetical protein JXR53_03295 [Bacteroidales bacterium]|jgi:hypothetical protein|nr:hypothetical protein [Bacteroidales bacterium]
MKYLWIIIFFVLAFASCKPTFVRKGLKEVKSERERLLESYDHLQSLDSSQVRDVYGSYFNKIDSINAYFNDQYSDGAWKIMTAYGAIKSPLKAYVKGVEKLNSDYNYSLQQLADLESDLKDKLISKEQYFIYMKSEKEANDRLIVQSKMIVDNASRSIISYNELSPQIDSLIIVFKAGL